jgi:TonB-linked SusC/RagA family outer membrane protein
MKLNPFSIVMHKPWLHQILRIMKLTTLIILVALLQCSAKGYGQKINLNENNSPLIKVLNQIKKQTGYVFFYDSKDVINKNVNVHLKDASVSEALNECLKNQSLTYKIVNKAIVLQQTDNIVIDQVAKPVIAAITIKGQVTDNNNQPLPGVTIRLKGDKALAIADADGKFSIDVPDNNAVLVFSFVGFVKKELQVTPGSTMLVKLEMDKSGLNEVVVLGYTSQKKENITGAVSSISVNETLRDIPATNLTALLTGQASGLNIQTNSGVPGVASNLSIRTNSSPNTAPALFVIDGVVRDKATFDLLDPSEIGDISILKDAASAAIYGSQSSGGVVLVTTKRGKAGKPVFNYIASTDVEQRTKVPSLMSAVQGAEFTNYMHPNDPSFFYYWDPNEIAYIKTVNNGYGADNLKAVWKNPTSMHHSLSVSGGSDRVRYYVGGSYLNQNGFLANLKYNKYDFRSNVSIDVTKNLTLFAQLATGSTTRNSLTFDQSYNLGDLYNKLMVWQPDWQMYTDKGQPIDNGWLGNIGEFTNGHSGYNTTTGRTTDVLINAVYKVPAVKGLNLKVQYANNFGEMNNRLFWKKQDLVQIKQDGAHAHIWTDTVLRNVQSNAPGKPYLQESSYLAKSYQVDLQVNYEHNFGKHNVSGVFVYEQSESKPDTLQAGRETFPIAIIDQFFATSGARADSYVTGSQAQSGRLSYIGMLGYNYAEKYFFNASVRRDGSSNFSPSQRWGYFPTVSAGWIVSKESFFKTDKIDFLKVRASAALSGNDNVISSQWLQTFNPAGNAYLGTPPSIYPGIALNSITNPNITWEKSRDYNIGIDMNFLTHFTLAADYWFKHTYDILGSRVQALPTSFGFALPAENYAKVDAHGIDVELGYRNNAGELSYSVKGTFSYGTNKVIQMDYPANGPAYANPNGKPLDFMTGYVYDKIIRTPTELNALPAEFLIFGQKPALGMMIYKDISGPNGKPDGIIDSYDQTQIASHSTTPSGGRQPAPPFRAGLSLGVSWKGFSIDMLFAGQFGSKIYNNGGGWVEWNRVPGYWLNHWTPENPNAPMPNPVSAFGPNTYGVNSTYWLTNNSFVRLKYLNLGYSLPKQWVNKLGVSNVKIFAAGTNLFYIASANKFLDIDPELGGINGYPVMKTFNLGLNVTF